MQTPLIYIALILILVGVGAYALKSQKEKRLKRLLPQLSDFPTGTEFIVKDFDVPLAKIPDQGSVIWVNWYSGTPRPYDPNLLSIDNNWSAESFESWVALVKASLR